MSTLLKRHQYVFVLLVACLGLALSVVVFRTVRASEQHKLKDHFEETARDRALALERSIDASVDVLQNIRSLYGASMVVEREEFRSFVAHALTENPDIQALEWIPRVSASQRATYEELASKDGFPQFQIVERQAQGTMVPAAAREEYFPVYFVEPHEGNEAALGFDLASSPTRLEALDKSRDTGEAVATARITLVQEEEDQFAFLVFLPIYRNGSQTATLAQRRENLIGFALGVFGIKGIVDQSLARASSEEIVSEIDIQLYDRSAPQGEQVLFSGTPGADTRGQVRPVFRFAHGFDEAGRNWEVIVTSSASQPTWEPWAVLGAGMLFTSLLSAYLVAGVRRTAAVERLVGERTAELSQSNVRLEEEVGERTRSEEALRNSEARNRALIHAIPDLMLRIRADGVFLDYIVAEDSSDLAVTPETFLGKNIHDVMPAEFADQVMRRVKQALDTGTGQTFEYQLPVPLGSSDIRDFEARIVVSGGDEVLAIVRDITERRAVERMKDEFISVVSHELRTPLTSIRGSLGLLAGGMMGALPEKGRHMLDIAVSNTDRLVRLINDILDIERMESGKITMERKDCDAADLMAQATDLVLKMAEEAGVTLSTTGQTAQLYADPDRILQTLTNLLSNAIKFSQPGGTVWLTAERQGDEMRFQVRDQGRGIPADKLESIFERFQQVDASDSRDKGGTGLGLAICRSIVQQHGGKIWVETALGQGSTFIFTLPTAVKEEQASRMVAPRGQTVMVCDDDPAALVAVRNVLEQRGYLVLGVSSGDTAIELAATRQPDAILLDLPMADVDGWETLATLKKRPDTKDIPIIVLSVVQPDGEAAAPSQVADWVTKPFDEEHLLTALKRVVGHDDKTPRVLVVEDDVDLARVIVSSFERHGIETLHAQTGRQAIEFSQEMVPDLLVLDLILPEGDGFTVVDWLRRHDRLRAVPLVVYTAKDLDDSDRARLRLGQTYFFTKGRIAPEDFERRVVGLVESVVLDKPERKDASEQ